jgi:(1->4)-alpha-D-glucan 1-alpha-D-glucosylmutase
MIPRATYRLQLHKAFTFGDAAAVVPYLAELGVSHVYTSPILKARAGSTHGYDMVDPTVINPELGGENGLMRLVDALRARDMGLIVDIVPNHMGVGGDENSWWLDVLRNGRSSPYADMFDIDWDRGGGKLLAPFLGSPYAEVLARGELKLVREEPWGWAVRYFSHLFPIRPEDRATLDAAKPIRFDTTTTEGQRALHDVLEHQHFRLAFWRTAPDAINWRRFFDVTELAALRADAPGVFERTHAKVLDLYSEGFIDGFRVDHVDGLADPGAYCRRLRAEMAAREAQRPAGRRGRAWLVVEKILASGEALDQSWDVDGTTGYDFMEETSRLFHDDLGYRRLAAHWAERTGRPATFAREQEAARREILERAFTAQLDGLVDALMQLASIDISDRDRPRAAVRRCLVEILAHFPRYRSYAAGSGVRDGEALAEALSAARRTCFPGDVAHLDRISEWLSPPSENATDRDLRRDVIIRFEQLCAPLAAKAGEDTAFYRYGPLLSRAEVGSDASIGGSPLVDWHAAMTMRAAKWPIAMLESSTHDHKRGEDVRARLSILSECSDLWMSQLDKWLAALSDQAPLVDVADRIMLLQTLVGAWPDSDKECEAFHKRVAAWQVKALREAKRSTSWDGPDQTYEAAARSLVDAILQTPQMAWLRAEIDTFVRTIEPASKAKGLIQTILKLTAPGVPDIYQGTEYRDFSLVDPDNRRAIDFSARRLSLGSPPTGADLRKQHLIRRLLEDRAAAPELFVGSYLPIGADGPLPLLAFARIAGARALAVICPLRTFGWVDEEGGFSRRAWQGARVCLPDHFRWRVLFDDRAILVEDLKSLGDISMNWPAVILRGTSS